MFASPPLFEHSFDPTAPVILGGPQFGNASYARPLQKKVRILLAALGVLVVSMLWIASHRPSHVFISTPAQKATTQHTALEATPTKASPRITLELKDDGVSTEIPSSQINIITEEAQRGEGVTKLARHAITQFTHDESITLSPEQRIYAEDFVQKATGANILRTGQKLSFPTDLLDKAVDKSQQLSPRELHNISKYSARVQNFNT